MRRKLNVLFLSVLLMTGLALISWSIVAQDEEIQQDMEEYAVLVEQVQVSEETETGDEYEVQELLPVPDTGNENTEAAETGQERPTAAPGQVNETMEKGLEAGPHDDSGGTPVGEQQTTQGTIIIVIPGEESGTEQTDNEQKEKSTAQSIGREPQETKPPKARETGKPTGNSSPPVPAGIDQKPEQDQASPAPSSLPQTSTEAPTEPPATETPAPVIVTAAPTPTPTPSPAPTPRIGKTGVDLEACKAQNGDFVAWLKIPGTKINYPVVWTDRVDYYLTHTFSGKESKIGTLFSLGKTDYATPGRNIAVYGHHITTSGGNMFQPLMSYKKKSFYENHKIIYFDTLYDLGEYTVFAVINMKSTEWDASMASFGSGQDFLAFVNRAKTAALYDTGIDVNENDHILTLITCDRDYHNPDGRLIVMAVKQ
ncbi:MAG: sortase [Clostridia bacterium]|nr:sortase [Clostridia bacterium]